MTQTTNNQSQQLTQYLKQEKQLAVNLLAYLLDEKFILEQNQPDELHSITEKKANCLDQLEVISRKRSQLLLAVSTEKSTIQRMQSFISRQNRPLQNLLNTQVDELELSLKDCQQQNLINGMIISMNQRNVQRNLNIIKGIDAKSMTYTQKGQTTAVGGINAGLKA